MVVALVLLLIFSIEPSNTSPRIAARLRHLLRRWENKFLTSDNDYFFRPSVALIYVVFVVVFLVVRAVLGQRPLSEQESLANALDLLES